MSTKLKLTPTLAKALAEKAIEQIKEARKKKGDEKTLAKARVTSHPQYNNYVELKKQINKLGKDASAIREKIKKSVKDEVSEVYFNDDGSISSIYLTNENSRISVDSIKNDLLIESNINNKDAQTIIAEIVKKYS